MNRWKKVRLGEITEVITKGTTPTTIGYSFTEEGVNFVKIESITPDGNFLLEKMEHISDECNEKMKRSKLQENDILFSIAGAIGRTAIVTESILPANTNQALAIIRLNTQDVLPEFLVTCLKSESIYKQFEKRKQGVAQLNLSLKDISELEIVYPDIQSQKAILKILQRARLLVDKRKEQIAACDEIIKSQFMEMFGDPATNPKGWEEVGVGKYLNVLTDYHSNGSYETLRDNVTLLDKPDYALMVRTTDLEKGNYENDVKYIDEHAYNHLEKSKVFGGEIIINKIGSAGKVYLMPYLNRPVSLAMNQFLLRFDESKVNHVFMYHLLTTPCCERRIQDKVRGAVTKTITKDAVREVNVIMPPIELQNQFVHFVQQVDKLKFDMQQSLVELENNFNSLMQRAFKGELF